MDVTCNRSTQLSDIVDGANRRSPLRAMSLYVFSKSSLPLSYVLQCSNIRQKTKPENKPVITKTIDQAREPPAIGTLPTEPESLDFEDALEMMEDSFEGDSAAYTTEWDSENEDAVSQHRFGKVFFYPDFLGH